MIVDTLLKKLPLKTPCALPLSRNSCMERCSVVPIYKDPSHG